MLWTGRGWTAGVGLAAVAAMLLGGGPLARHLASQRQGLPAKSSVRLELEGEAKAAKSIRHVALSVASGADPGMAPGKLRECCGLLGLAAVHGLLDEEALWKYTGRDGDRWEQVEERRRNLQAVREVILERLATIDLAGGLRSRPGDTAGLLRAAAGNDGAAALSGWLAFRQEWRDSPAARAGIRCTLSTEDGAVDNTVEVAEQKLMAAFMEGWGRSDPEAAWHALTAGHPEMKSERALDGLVDGLPPGSDWKRWAGRIEGLEYGKSPFFQASPESDCFLGLARKWMVEDPSAALAQFQAWETGWETQRHSLQDDDLSDLNLPGIYFLSRSGISGHAEGVDAKVFLVASWIGAQADVALAWVGSEPDGDALLGELTAWSSLPRDVKLRLIATMRDPERRAHFTANLDFFQEHPASP